MLNLLRDRAALGRGSQVMPEEDGGDLSARKPFR